MKVWQLFPGMPDARLRSLDSAQSDFRDIVLDSPLWIRTCPQRSPLTQVICEPTKICLFHYDLQKGGTGVRSIPRNLGGVFRVVYKCAIHGKN